VAEKPIKSAAKGGPDTMEKQYKVQVFGKAGCDKCKMLNRRLDKLFQLPEWQDFEKEYCDLETERGLVAFCRTQCVNPNRIPALVINRRKNDGTYEPVENMALGERDPVCGASKLYQYLGLQTDYTPTGRGVISPKMITSVLEQARSA
jgi:glutaredoxin